MYWNSINAIPRYNYMPVYRPPLLTPYLIPILTPSPQPPPSRPHPWLLCPSHWVFHGLLCLVDGLECVQCLVQQEGSVVNQHIQVEVEGRVLSLISGGREGKERSLTTTSRAYISSLEEPQEHVFSYKNNNLTVRKSNNLYLLNTCQVVWYKLMTVELACKITSQ